MERGESKKDRERKRERETDRQNRAKKLQFIIESLNFCSFLPGNRIGLAADRLSLWPRLV